MTAPAGLLQGDEFVRRWRELHPPTRRRIRREVLRPQPRLDDPDLAAVAAGYAYRQLQQLPYWGYGGFAVAAIFALVLENSGASLTAGYAMLGAPLPLLVGLTLRARRLARALVASLARAQQPARGPVVRP